MNSAVFKIYILVLTLITISCELFKTTSGEKTENFINGIAIVEDTGPASNTTVYLRSTIATTHGDTVLFYDSTTTDNNGAYQFSKLDTNHEYSLYSRSGNYSGLSPRAVISKEDLPELDSNNVLMLKPTTYIKGKVLHASAGKVFIPGTGIYTDINSNGEYEIQNALSGQYVLGLSDNSRLGIMAVEINSADSVNNLYDLHISDVELTDNQLADFVTAVSPHDVDIEKYLDQPKPAHYSNANFDHVQYYGFEEDGTLVPRYGTYIRVSIDPTQADMTIAQDTLKDFPYLILLDSNHIDFTEWNAQGCQIKVVLKDCCHLQFEIGNIDLENKQAELWVKIPELITTATTELDIYWTNPDSTSHFNDVFTSENNFYSVWHGHDLLNSVDKNELDQAAWTEGFHNYNGGKGFLFNTDTEGEFLMDKAIPAYFPNQNDFTLSAWVKLDNLKIRTLEIQENTIEHWNIMSRKDSFRLYYESIDKRFVFAVKTSFDLEDRITVYDFAHSNIQVESTDQYFHVLGKRDKDRIYLYVNGELQTSNGIDSIYVSDNPLTIGAQTKYFEGMIDEARIAEAARSETWIQMSYANQKANSKITQYELREEK